jgi:hypothetical protein
MGQNVKTRQVVADEYGISTKTLNAWLRDAELDIPSRKLICPHDLEKIYRQFGLPKSSQNSSNMPKKS